MSPWDSSFFRVPAPDPPEVGKWPVPPEQPAVRHFVELGDAHAFGVGGNMFGHDVHGHFGQVQVGADACGGGDAGLVVDRPHDVACQFVRGFSVGVQVARGVHEHFVDGVDVDVVRGGVPQVDAVYFSAGVEIVRHSRLGDVYVDRQARIGFQLVGVIRCAAESMPWRAQLPFRVDLAQFLPDFEQSGTPGQPVGLQ